MNASPITVEHKKQNFKIRSWFYTAFFCIVAFLVLINVFTPLRLNNDAARYLQILEYMLGTIGPNSSAAHDFLPHGYPAFLLLLQKIHFLSPFSITLANIICIAVASYLMTRLFEIENKLFYCTLVLLSFINVKQFTLPVSDQFFTLLFITAIYLWLKVFKGKRNLLVPALVVTVLSIYVRTAGIAIVAGIFFYFIYFNKTLIQKSKILLALVIFGFIAPLISFISAPEFFEKKVDYLKQLNLEQLINSPLLIFDRLFIHFKELGEIIINTPYSKLSSIISAQGFDIAGYVLIITGILSLVIYIKLIGNLQLYKSSPFWIFISYLAMIFIWPFYDTRFLIPILPLLIYLFFTYLALLLKARVLKFSMIALYISLGVVSLLYSDALSLSKPFFLSHYGADPNLTKFYRIHFTNGTLKTRKPVYDINTDYTLYLLEEYDRKPFYTLQDAANDK